MISTSNKTDKHLYEKVAENLKTKILSGVFKAWEPLPAVRKLSKDLGISISSVMQSYTLLESLGLIEARPKSGYYVLPVNKRASHDETNSKFNISIADYNGEELVAEINEEAIISSIIPLGAGIPSTENLPGKKLNNILARICKSPKTQGIDYEFPPGDYKLRSQIAKHSVSWGSKDLPEDIIITTGATEGLLLSLKAVANPGDTILTESPVYFGILQIIKSLGMHVVEVPTDPHQGLDMDALENALKKHKIACAIFCPNISNPLCSILPLENKKKLYKILTSKDIPIIEDDVYGELYFGHSRPKPIKALDENGDVIYISSFSKTVAPGYRIGWVSAGRYYEKIKRLKFATSLATPTLPQIALSEFLRLGLYEQNLLRLRKTYSSQVSSISKCISEFFPIGTKISKPQGGYYLWIELSKSINSIKLQKYALRKNISIAPGPLFTSTNDYTHFIRISCGFPFTKEIKDAIKTLGHICNYVI